MGKRHLMALAAVLVFGSHAPAAHAQDEDAEETYDGPRHRARLDLGLASALGFGGVAYTYSPREWLQLEAGVGMAFAGPTLSLMPKYAFFEGNDHLVLGAGVAFARAIRGGEWADEYSLWINADVGFEHVFDSGVLIAVAAGISKGDRSETLTPWKSTGSSDYGLPVLPQLRFGVGYAFGGTGRPEDEAQAPSQVQVQAAETEPGQPWSRKNRFGADLGVGSAVGELGVSYSRVLSDSSLVELGAGVGVTGLQLSLMPKLTIGSDGNYYVAGFGVAYAAGVSDDPMFWLNADLLGYERRMENGWGFSVALGGTYCVSGSAGGRNFPIGEGGLAPQLRLGAAYWL